MWDGDQLLYDWRTADGTATALNSGSADYVHVEGLDQPVGVIRSDGTRVINYTWRGLGESRMLDEAVSRDDLDLPGYRLHQLKGSLRGFLAMTVNANWRIIFRLEDGHVYDVQLIDYH